MRGFDETASLFPGVMLKNATHTHLPEIWYKSNQSDEDFKTPEVFPISVPYASDVYPAVRGCDA